MRGDPRARRPGAPRLSRRAGAALVETLVAAGLVALAAAAVATAGAAAALAVRLERELGAALWLSVARLESLRLGPREDGADTVILAEGTSIARRWRVEAGRGLPDGLSVTASWRGRTIVLATEVWP